MSETASTLLGVFVGAIVGFIGSIGFYKWQAKSQNKATKARLKDELLFIRKRIQEKIDKGDFLPVAFDYAFYSFVRPTVVSVLDAETFEMIRRTYDEINSLGSGKQLKERYEGVIASIDSAVERL